MPQSIDKINLDMKLAKGDIKKNLISKPAGLVMDSKHKNKINNIVNDAQILQECYIDEKKVNSNIRRYMEPSQGDSIFHRDEVN